MSTQLLELVFILLPIHICVLLEELLHLRFGRFLAQLHFLLSTDLILAWLGFGSASPWIEVHCISFLLEEVSRFLPGHSLSLLHFPLASSQPHRDFVMLPRGPRTTTYLVRHPGQVVSPGTSVYCCFICSAKVGELGWLLGTRWPGV